MKGNTRDIQVLYETDHWLAVNKPAGLIVEKSPFENYTLEDWARSYLSERVKKPFLGIVHRLDRLTSGVLLLAKKKSTLKALNAQFEARRVKKTYLALVDKAPDQKANTLEHWLKKDLKNKQAEVVRPMAPGSKPAILHYRLLNRLSSAFLLEIHPSTGRFHQIRAQLSAVGCPIVGDVKYGGREWSENDAIGLHATRVKFFAPDLQKDVVVKTEWPLLENENAI